MTRRQMIWLGLLFTLSAVVLQAQSFTPTPIPTNNQTVDEFASFDRDVLDMTVKYSTVYVGMALGVLNKLAVLVLVSTLSMAAWEAIRGHQILNYEFIVRKWMIPYMFSFYVLNHWITPIDGLGISFVGMFTNTSADLAAQANIKTLNDLYGLLNNVRDGIGLWSAITSTGDMIAFGAITGLMIFVKAAVYFVTSVGVLGLGIGACLGPIMILFFMWPPLRHKWFAWVDAMIKYALYRVVGNLVIGVWCTFMISFFHNLLSGGLDLMHLISQMISFGTMMIVFALGVFRVGHFVNDFTSGGASAGHGMTGSALSFIRGVFL